MTRIALIEMWRSRAQYGPIVAALSLIVFLVFVLSALADGLFAGQTEALTTSDAQVQVFDDASRDSLPQSTLDPNVAEQIEAVENVDAVGELSVLLGGADAPTGEFDVALFGFAPDSPGGPTTLASGVLPAAGGQEVVAIDRTLATEKGVSIGDTVRFAGSETELEVVGIVERTRFSLQPSLWVPTDQFRAIRSEVRPETRSDPDAVGGMPVRIHDDADPGEVAEDIASEVDGISAVTTDEAVRSIPGVAQQAITLQSVIIATYLVAALVITLFFALITLEKRTLLAMLKALGGSTRSLGAGLVIQALVSAGAALVLGGLMTAGVIAVVRGTVPVQLDPTTIASVIPATLVTAAVGAALSYRRVSRVDPASALGGTL